MYLTPSSKCIHQTTREKVSSGDPTFGSHTPSSCAPLPAQFEGRAEIGDQEIAMNPIAIFSFSSLCPILTALSFTSGSPRSPESPSSLNVVSSFPYQNRTRKPRRRGRYMPHLRVGVHLRQQQVVDRPSKTWAASLTQT